jgi:hypothetical protein
MVSLLVETHNKGGRCANSNKGEDGGQVVEVDMKDINFY